MNLLLVTQLPPPKGGIAAWSEAYLNYMKSTEHSVSVVNTAAIGNRSNDVNASKSLSTELKRAFGIWKAARSAVRQNTFDLAHVNVVGTVTGMVRDRVTLSLLGKRLPKVIEFHSNLPDQIGSSRLGLFLLRSIVRKADQVLVLNSFSREYLQQHTGVTAGLVSNFADDDFLRSTPKEISQDLTRVIFTGHIVPGKGVLEILTLAEDFPEIQFDLLGRQPKEVTLPPCPENVHLLGEKSPEQVREALDGADLFLFPSHTEGFSLSLTEAMARGLPVIATDVGANRDMLEEKGGILVPVEDVNALKQALRQMKAPGLRRDQARWNLQKVNTCYTARAVFTRFLEIYQNTMERKG